MELVEHYKSLIDDQSFVVSVEMVDNDQVITRQDGTTTSLLERKAAGVTDYSEKNNRANVYLSREPLVNKNGKLTPAIQRIDEQGITSIHEIGGHAYYFQQGVKGWDNDSETSSFEGRVRQFYRGKYLKNYIKRQPVIQHHYF